LIFGELAGGTSPRVERLAGCFAQADLEAVLHPNIWTALWEKYLITGATSGLTALTRQPLGAILADQELRELVVGMLTEGEAVAKASGVKLPDDCVPRLLRTLDACGPNARSSQYYDLMAGQRLELESLSGALVRLARARGVPTPLNFAIYAALKPYVNGPPGPEPGERPATPAAST
jgi:2-dehydropantoate 2-reductase